MDSLAQAPGAGHRARGTGPGRRRWAQAPGAGVPSERRVPDGDLGPPAQFRLDVIPFGSGAGIRPGG